MAEDLLEKGAIIQRDKATYAIAPHIPGGIITDFNLLRRLADVAEKYGVKAMKLTSAQRIALVGLKLEDLDPIWQELGMVPGAAIGLCVRSIKICPGTTFCRMGMQDAVAVGLHLDEKYHGMPLPFKFKIGVSGCPNNCSESCIKDSGSGGRGQGLAGAGRRIWVGPQTPPGRPHRHRPHRCRGPRPGRADAGLVQGKKPKEAPGPDHRRYRPGYLQNGTGPAGGVS